MSRRYADQYGYWTEVVRMHEEIGGSAAAFCRVEGLTVSQFYQWRLRLRRQGAQTEHSGTVAAFVPLRFAGDDAGSGTRSGVSVEVSDARIVLDRGFDTIEMMRAVSALRGERC